MQVEEVSKALESLADVVNRKSAELDRLKREYTQKIEILNGYIRKFHSNTSEQSEPADDNAILELLTSKIACPSCLKEIYLLDSENEYILVPKRLVRLLETQQHKSNEQPTDAKITVDTVTKSLGEMEVTNEENVQPVVARKLHHSKQKRTCSYCKKPGHSRARCFARLNKDPTEPKQQSPDSPQVAHASS